MNKKLLTCASYLVFSFASVQAYSCEVAGPPASPQEPCPTFFDEYEFQENWVLDKQNNIQWLKLSLSRGLPVSNVYTQNGWNIASTVINQGPIGFISNIHSSFGAEGLHLLSGFMNDSAPEDDINLFAVAYTGDPYNWVGWLDGGINATVGSYSEYDILNCPDYCYDAGNEAYWLVRSVPIPAAAWLFGSALIGLLAAKRKC